jgi:formate-dependent phosphoribosylglycinamide formyltransferase (GAR transformylase)
VKTVLVIGAGRYQRAVIQRAKDLGYRVVAVDRNPDAPGFAYADIGRVVDFSDADAVRQCAIRRLGAVTDVSKWATFRRAAPRDVQ